MPSFKKMSIKSNLIVSSVAFVLPIAVLLYFTVAGINANIDFARLEQHGNAYQQPLEVLLKGLTDFAIAQALGDGSASAAASSDVDKGFAALSREQAEHGVDLQVTSNGLESRQRSRVAPGNLQSRWTGLKSLDGAKAAEAAMALVADVRELISHIGDTSNLILDPDLDSYYVMDATLLALPQAQERLAAALLFGVRTIAKGQLDEKDRVTLAVYRTMLAENDASRVSASLKTAQNEDDKFYGHYEPLHAQVTPVLTRFEQYAAGFTALLDRLASSEGKVSVEEFARVGREALRDSFNLWEVASRELDDLLGIRIEYYAGERLTALVATGFALLLAISIVILNARAILAAVAALLGYAGRVAGGDLAATLAGTYSPEFNRLRDAIAAMVASLKAQMQTAEQSGQEAHQAKDEAEAALVRAEEQQRELAARREELAELGLQINQLAERVASASEELSASADEQARGALRQKEQSDAVATAMNEMASSVVEVARNAASTSEAADKASNSARNGASLVQDAVNSINQVSKSAGRLSKVLSDLDGQAGEIGRIIGVINDIADQTNLLALNAAIEAARAGDAGRGFAVVADEVRKLAEKTMVATKEVEEAIRLIQDGSRQAVTSMDDTRQLVDQSTGSANNAGQSLQEIMSDIEGMTGRVTQIATAAEQQSSAAEEINRSVEEITVIAGEAEQGAEQAASATRDLAQLSQELLTLSMRFSDSKSDESLLRQSRGKMRGILPKLMQEFIRKEYGDRVFTAMHEEMGRPTFLPGNSYPDQVLRQMADFVSGLTRRSAAEIFEGLGRHTIKEFKRMYGRYIKGNSLKEFYLTMNETHANLTKDMPGIRPPRFTFEDRGDTLVMTYESSCDYGEYFIGILKGAAEFFKQRVDITSERLGPERIRATIRFR